MNRELSCRGNVEHPHLPMRIDLLGAFVIRLMFYGAHCLLIGNFYHSVSYLHPPMHFLSSVESQEIL